MKRISSIIFAAAAVLAMSCELHTSDNGELDGFWQLVQTDTLTNGRSEDVRPKRIFWSVQADLLRMQDLHDDFSMYPSIYYYFELKDQTLRVYHPVVDRREISDSLVTSVETVRFYGLNHLDETFKVLQLGDEKMTLENERLRMYFRKY
ncbi:MAG: lipocalin-like domain-containing protein [Prevotella sp.]|nr:lipocalin-like domain-containing protein [Prevotella sp.]